MAAIAYDTIIIFFLGLLATAFWTSAGVHANSNLYPLYKAFIFAFVFFYYGWFWTHGGQTIGMKTWKIRLVRIDGLAFNWVHAASRSAMALISLACLGSGFLAVLKRPRRVAWHDTFSASYLAPE